MNLKLQKNKVLSALFFLVVLAGSWMPQYSFAHGGVEKSTDNVTVFLTQTPLSPLVGEKVKMTFVVTNSKNKLERLKNFEVQLSLIDTFYGDATRDKTILKETKYTDTNGALEFEYTFGKENFFDIDLEFTNPITKEMDDIGFLVLPRTPQETKNNVDYVQLGAAGLLGMIIGFIIKYYGHKTTQRGA